MAEEEQKLKLNIKTTRQKVEVEVERDSTVKQVSVGGSDRLSHEQYHGDGTMVNHTV